MSTSYDDNIDHDEHAYWAAYCPACDASPCVGDACASAPSEAEAGTAAWAAYWEAQNAGEPWGVYSADDPMVVRRHLED